MKILELKQSSAERFIIKFDDGTEIKSSLSVVTEFFLHSGLELNDEEYRRLISASSLSLAKSRALRIVNMRPLSQKELISKLCEKGESPENAEYCAKWLCDIGLLNDESYAGSVVRHYSAKGYGEARIRQELSRHGIPRELWDSALDEMPEQDDYPEQFIRSRLNDPNDRIQIKKLSDALYRRGYSWEQIKHALNSFISQEDL